jgi:hypothetical protein
MSKKKIVLLCLNYFRLDYTVGRGLSIACNTFRMLVILVFFIYCFTSRSRISRLYGDVTIADEGLQNLSLCSALRAFEQGGVFIVPHLL